MSSDDAGDSTELTNVREILDAMINKIPKDNSYYFDGKYTVFTAIKSEKREVTIHIPFLYEILNPKGSHGMKDDFLKKFFKIVLHEEYHQRTPPTVFKEYTIPKDANVTGRIDLYIESREACYPIEIKIDAKDQSKQIERYHTFAKNNKKHFKVLYLTLHGRKPSKFSMGELQNKNKNKNINVFSISFAGDFYSWITECVKLAAEKKSLEVANAINQYKILIEKLTGIEQEREYMEDIRNIIKNNYKSAVEIERSIKAVRTEKLVQFISDLSKYLGKKWDLEIVEDDESKFDKYYEDETYPGVSFVLKPMPKKNITVYFRLEIDEGHLGYGVRFLYGENNEWKPEKYMDVRNAFPNSRWKNIVENHSDKKNCWLWWNNLNKIFDADFVGCDTADYVKLFDAEEYKKMLEEIKAEIDENMPSIMEKGVPKEDPDQLI